MPYLAFIRDHVFLKFDTRAYKIPSQKWKVSAYALRIFYQVSYFLKYNINTL